MSDMPALLERAAVLVRARMVLRDYRVQYAPAVVRAYEARPALEDAAVPAWRAAARFVERQFRQTATRLKIEFVDQDAYEGSYDRLMREVRETGVLKVWTGESQHPVWSPVENWMFRALHDYQAHITGKHPFSLRGELAAYNRHVKTFPRAAWPCLFTEVVGQVSCAIVLGKFVEQKVAYLHGFDYQNVGVIDEDEYKKNFPEGAEPALEEPA